MIALEWCSTLLSFAGTYMIARHAHVGWLCCFTADAGFVVFAVRKQMWGFLALCFGYGCLNLYGWFS
jgi:hypothetical protein